MPTFTSRLRPHRPVGRAPLRTIAAALVVAAPFVVGGSSAAASAWPGRSAVQIASDMNVGGNVSGLAYQASGSATPGVLWAVQNNPSKLYRLTLQGGTWNPDPTNGWANGKTLAYPGGGGVPDAEGVTLVSGDAGAVYVSTERNDVKGSDKQSRPSVLRYDVTAPGALLSASTEWNLAADLPGLAANAGLEAVAWVPDALLVSKGFRDESTGAAYSPATYPDHAGGIFFVGVETTGQVVGYALSGAGTFTRVATIGSGLAQLMDLSYDPGTTRLWAVCDDKCNGQLNTLEIATAGVDAGTFVVTNSFDRPAGMDDLNNEGFTTAADAECTAGVKPVFWADDSNTGGHALRSGTLNCASAGNPPVDPPVVVPPVVNPPIVVPPVVVPPVVVNPPAPNPPVTDAPVAAPPATNAPLAEPQTSAPTPPPAPTPTATAAPPAVAAPEPKPSLTGLPAKTKPSKKGVVKLTVSCMAGGCSGTLRLTARLGTKTQTIGSGSFKLTGAAASVFSVTLSPAAKKALRTRSITATVMATVGGQTSTRTIVLRKTA